VLCCAVRCVVLHTGYCAVLCAVCCVVLYAVYCAVRWGALCAGLVAACLLRGAAQWQLTAAAASCQLLP
jgi:hypothetical protein